jgi:hypothetical protein
MYCRVGDRLFREYREAVREWVASINELRDDHGERLLNRIEEARSRVLLARDVFENHGKEHGCAWKDS